MELNVKTLTYDYIQKHKTDAGGWTKKQLSILGVEWPPKSGWIDDVCGKTITEEDAVSFEESKFAHKKKVKHE